MGRFGRSDKEVEAGNKSGKTLHTITWDIETYPGLFMVCALIDSQRWQEYIVCPDVDGYPNEVNPSVIKSWLDSLKNYDVHATYNGKAFDIRVLAWIASLSRPVSTEEIGLQAGKLIDEMNEGHTKSSKCWDVKYSDMVKYRTNHFDVFKNYTGKYSLKYWEMARGWTIKESDIPFSEKHFNAEMLEECRKYCRNDVVSTDMLLHEKACLETMEWRKWVIENAPCKIVNDETEAAMAEYFVYGDDEVEDETKSVDDYIDWDSFDVPEDFKCRMKKVANREIIGFAWRFDDNAFTEFTKSVDLESFKKGRIPGFPEPKKCAVFGVGGAHFANAGVHEDDEINDVASMYPACIVNIVKLKTAKATKRYNDVRLFRLENKKKKGTPAYSKPADVGPKKVLNGLSGKFRQPGAKAYAPNCGVAMCVIGQMTIVEAMCYALGGKMYYKDAIEINTDSFAVHGEENKRRAKEYCEQKRHGFEFEAEKFHKSYWRDVNNYVVWNADGSIKEIHGSIRTNLEIVKDRSIVTRSLISNIIFDKDAEPSLEKSDNFEDYIVKYSKSANVVNASFGGEKLTKKYCYFLWTKENCPDSKEIVFNDKRIGDDGTIQPRHGVMCFDLEHLMKYAEYIDRDQYLEDLKKELVVWGRTDMVKRVSAKSLSMHSKTFHDINNELNTGFFKVPGGLF